MRADTDVRVYNNFYYNLIHWIPASSKNCVLRLTKIVSHSLCGAGYCNNKNYYTPTSVFDRIGITSISLFYIIYILKIRKK